MKIFVTFLTLYLAFSFSARGAATQDRAAGQGAGPRLTVRARGRGLVLSEGGRRHALALGGQIDAARVEDVSLLFVTRRADFTYLLLDVCGPSKARPDDRQCGAGVECNLVWVKVDGLWRVSVSPRSVRYESCWLPITSADGYKVEGRVLRMQYSDLREQKEYRLIYDAEQPEQGFVVEESPASDNPR